MYVIKMSYDELWLLEGFHFFNCEDYFNLCSRYWSLNDKIEINIIILIFFFLQSAVVRDIVRDCLEKEPGERTENDIRMFNSICFCT